MANILYDLGRQAFLEGDIDYITDTIKVALVRSTYTPNVATHQYYSDLTPGTHVVGTPQTLTSKSSTAGVANASSVTFSSVTGGSTVSYLVLYKDTGVNSTSPLIALIDTATGLPVSTNGGDITISWDTGSNKIFKL
jgi:hypothetical protein